MKNQFIFFILISAIVLIAGISNKPGAFTSSTTGVAFKLNTGRQNASNIMEVYENNVLKFKIDSAGRVFAYSAVLTPNDTTVAAYGKIVFKTSDSTFYGCKYIRPTGKQKWFKLDN